MNDLIASETIVGMTSKEIADLTGKKHYNIMRDINVQFRQLEIDALKFEGIYKDSSNRQHKCYILDKEQTLILASGYNVKLRSAIINRWIELEEKTNSKNQIPMMSDVEKYQALLDQAKTIEHLQLENRQQAKEFERKVGQGYKAQYNKKEKLVKTIQSTVGVTYQRDIVRGIEYIKEHDKKATALAKKYHKLYNEHKNNDSYRDIDHNKYYTVTELSKRFGTSAIKLNKLLAEKGFQERVGKTWVATPKGEPLCTLSEYSNDGGVYNVTIRWMPIISEYL
jgi:phage regulator Rha-like protein